MKKKAVTFISLAVLSLSLTSCQLLKDVMDEVMEHRNEEWLRALCKELGRTLKAIGDDLNIISEREYAEAIGE